MCVHARVCAHVCPRGKEAETGRKAGLTCACAPGAFQVVLPVGFKQSFKAKDRSMYGPISVQKFLNYAGEHIFEYTCVRKKEQSVGPTPGSPHRALQEPGVGQKRPGYPAFSSHTLASFPLNNKDGVVCGLENVKRENVTSEQGLLKFTLSSGSQHSSQRPPHAFS